MPDRSTFRQRVLLVEDAENLNVLPPPADTRPALLYVTLAGPPVIEAEVLLLLLAITSLVEDTATVQPDAHDPPMGATVTLALRLIASDLAVNNEDCNMEADEPTFWLATKDVKAGAAIPASMPTTASVTSISTSVNPQK